MSERIDLVEGVCIEKDAEPGSSWPDRLQIYDDLVWLTRDQTDALAALVRDNDLPPGIRWATVIEPGTKPPEGWERQGIGNGWTGQANHTPYAIEARRKAAPATVKVPWQQAIGRKLPDGREITGAWPSRDMGGAICVGDGRHLTNNVPQPDADGMVTVLAEGDES